MPEKKKASRGELILHGIGVSPGVAICEAVVLAHNSGAVPDYPIREEDIPLEITRFEESLIQTRHQIAEIQDEVSKALGNEQAGIFDAHLLVVDDRYLIEEVICGLRKDFRNVEFIIHRVVERYIEILSKVEDDYLRERATDIHDVTRRIIRNLVGEGVGQVDQIDKPCVVVTHDLSPSDTASMNRDLVMAFATDLGSTTSHASIMARALEIPAVVGVRNISAQVATGETVLIDGGAGLVIIRPTSDRLLEYARKAEEHKTILSELATLRDEPSETKDGVNIPLVANIELVSELKSIRQQGVKGIGLFRTEFLFLQNDLPSEEEQCAVYSEVADSCSPGRVVIRTLDMGGDKLSLGIPIDSDSNPFFGCRAIRYCLANPALFKVQLRAILRASIGRNIAVLYPMINGLDEVFEANRILEECRQELLDEGVRLVEKIPVGVMIEIPSAALTAEKIAPHVDFFSIGTNDLIQYTMAVDRVDESVAHLYQPTNAAVLKLIHMVVQAGRVEEIPTAVCGQMAASPELIPLLIGLGVDELSISPPSILMIKDVIRNLHYSECVELAQIAMQTASATEVLSLCRDLLAKRSPEILELMS